MRPIPLTKAPDLDAAELTTDTPVRPREASVEEVNLCARVPRDLRARVKTRAVEEDRSVQDLVIDAVTAYLDQPART